MEWEFSKSSIKGYGMLLDPKGNDYSVSFDDDKNIKVTTTKRHVPFKIPKKVEQMILAAISK